MLIDLFFEFYIFGKRRLFSNCKKIGDQIKIFSNSNIKKNFSNLKTQKFWIVTNICSL